MTHEQLRGHPIPDGWVITQDKSSGAVHLRAVHPQTQRLYSDEACNADDAGGFRVVSAADLLNTSPDKFCANCFPRMRDGDVDSTQ